MEEGGLGISSWIFDRQPLSCWEFIRMDVVDDACICLHMCLLNPKNQQQESKVHFTDCFLVAILNFWKMFICMVLLCSACTCHRFALAIWGFGGRVGACQYSRGRFHAQAQTSDVNLLFLFLSCTIFGIFRRLDVSPNMNFSLVKLLYVVRRAADDLGVRKGRN